MTGQFHVEEGHVAGFGAMTEELHGQMLSCLVHVHEARPGSGYDGLMSALVGPMSTYCDGVFDRVSPLSALIGGMRDVLTVTAWDYHGTDQSVYEEVRELPPPALPGDTVTVVRDFPHAVAYSAGAVPALDVPDHEEADIQGLIDDVGGSINVIDWVVREVTGWSPVEAIVEPLAGNYAELERAATVLEQFGTGFEQVADNLTTPLSRLSQHWQGGAASSFEDYTSRLGAAVAIEGPMNRLVAYVLKEVAGEFERVAEFMVTTLKSAVDKVATSVATGWIPFVGWYKAYKTVREVIDIFNEAKALVESLQETIEQVQAVIEAVQDPVGFVQGQAEEILGPYIDAAGIAQDLAALDPSALQDAPSDLYDVGADPQRAG